MNKKTLPQGWVWSTLGEIADYGKTIKAEPCEIGPDEWVLELEDIEKDSSVLLQRIYNSVRKSKSTKNRFKKSDVLYGKLRPYLNKVLLADNHGVCSTEIIPLSAPAGVDERYLFYFLKHPYFIEYVSNISHGLNMPRLGTKAGRAAVMPIAPSAEQNRITDKLDALIGRVDACRERLDRVPPILKRFRQAVLSAATSGQLTEDWRKENSANLEMGLIPIMEKSQGLSSLAPDRVDSFPEVPAEWKWTNIGKIAEVKGGKRLPKGESLESRDSGQPYVRATNLKQGTVGGEMLFVPQHLKSKIKNYIVRSGDAYITIVGACIGDAGTIPPEYDGANLTENAARIRGTTICASSFIASWLRAPFCQNEIQSSILSAAQGKLALFRIEQLPIAHPSFTEQIEVVRKIEKLFALADCLEARYIAARHQLEQMTPSLLSKAFSGELVPQDPTDEPAEKLLERIRTAQPSSAPSQLMPVVGTTRPAKKSVSLEPIVSSPVVTQPPSATTGNIPQAILAAMQPGREYIRADILNTTGIKESDWLWAIRQLRDGGKVVQIGERRGARYRKVR